jgi:hypothetical protein
LGGILQRLPGVTFLMYDLTVIINLGGNQIDRLVADCATEHRLNETHHGVTVLASEMEF